MQDKIFKVKIFEVTHKSVKSVKVFSLEIFRLYGKLLLCTNFILFLNFDLDDTTKATLSDILQFITGLRKIPPLGFDRKITL